MTAVSRRTLLRGGAAAMAAVALPTIPDPGHTVALSAADGWVLAMPDNPEHIATVDRVAQTFTVRLFDRNGLAVAGMVSFTARGFGDGGAWVTQQGRLRIDWTKEGV